MWRRGRSLLTGASRVLARTGIVFALALGCVGVAADTPIPPLRARVTDLTGTLNASQLQSLESRLAAFEQKKGSQIAVLMLPSTKPEAIEQYSIRVAEAWKIGRKGTDDGLILVIAKDDHRLRIEVGRGLEGAIPDVVAKRVIREIIAPHFLNADFYGGITAGSDALIKLIEGEPLPAPAGREQGARPVPGTQTVLGWQGRLMVLAVCLVPLLFVRALAGRFLGSGIGAFLGGQVVLMMFESMLAAVITGLVLFAFLLVLPFGAIRSMGGRGSGWHSGGGGWSGGGGLSGGGGFSGGGGDFGGGGASGDW